MLSLDKFKELKINGNLMYSINGGRHKDTRYNKAGDASNSWADMSGRDDYETTTMVTSYPNENWSDSKEDL